MSADAIAEARHQTRRWERETVACASAAWAARTATRGGGTSVRHRRIPDSRVRPIPPPVGSRPRLQKQHELHEGESGGCHEGQRDHDDDTRSVPS